MRYKIMGLSPLKRRKLYTSKDLTYPQRKRNMFIATRTKFKDDSRRTFTIRKNLFEGILRASDAIDGARRFGIANIIPNFDFELLYPEEIKVFKDPNENFSSWKAMREALLKAREENKKITVKFGENMRTCPMTTVPRELVPEIKLGAPLSLGELLKPEYPMNKPNNMSEELIHDADGKLIATVHGKIDNTDLNELLKIATLPKEPNKIVSFFEKLKYVITQRYRPYPGYIIDLFTERHLKNRIGECVDCIECCKYDDGTPCQFACEETKRCTIYNKRKCDKWFPISQKEIDCMKEYKPGFECKFSFKK